MVMAAVLGGGGENGLRGPAGWEEIGFCVLREEATQWIQGSCGGCVGVSR